MDLISTNIDRNNTRKIASIRIQNLGEEGLHTKTLIQNFINEFFFSSILLKYKLNNIIYAKRNILNKAKKNLKNNLNQIVKKNYKSTRKILQIQIVTYGFYLKAFSIFDLML